MASGCSPGLLQYMLDIILYVTALAGLECKEYLDMNIYIYRYIKKFIGASELFPCKLSSLQFFLTLLTVRGLQSFEKSSDFHTELNSGPQILFKDTYKQFNVISLCQILCSANVSCILNKTTNLKILTYNLAS